MAATVRLGMIGLGRFASLHARIWQQMPDVVVSAICDRNPAACAAFQHMFPQVRCYTDWQEMLANEPLDAVDILTPEHLHVEPVLAALMAGMHVFVEKPLATTPWDADKLVCAAEQHERLLMAGHVLRFDARYAGAKARVAQGAAGMIRSIYAKRNNGKQYFSTYNRISPIFILGIHDIDLMHWLYEDDVIDVYATRSSSGHPTEDLIWTMLRFRRGGIGILENNWLFPDGADSFMDVRMEITGEDGSLFIRDPERGLTQIGTASADAPSLLSGYEVHGQIGGPLAQQLAHFIACVQSGQPSDVLRPQDAAQAVRVAWAIQQSARRGQRIRLDDAAGMTSEADADMAWGGISP